MKIVLIVFLLCAGIISIPFIFRRPHPHDQQRAAPQFTVLAPPSISPSPEIIEAVPEPSVDRSTVAEAEQKDEVVESPPAPPLDYDTSTTDAEVVDAIRAAKADEAKRSKHAVEIAAAKTERLRTIHPASIKPASPTEPPAAPPSIDVDAFSQSIRNFMSQPAGYSGPRTEHVNSYVKKNGTVVGSYYRRPSN